MSQTHALAMFAARLVLVADAVIGVVLAQRILSHPENHWGVDNRLLIPLFAAQLLVGVALRNRLAPRLWLAVMSAGALSLLASVLIVQLNILLPYEVWLERGMPERGASSRS